MRENKKRGKIERFSPKVYCIQSFPVQVLTEAYILLRTREITKMYGVPKLHRG